MVDEIVGERPYVADPALADQLYDELSAESLRELCIMVLYERGKLEGRRHEVTGEPIDQAAAERMYESASDELRRNVVLWTLRICLEGRREEQVRKSATTLPDGSHRG